MAYNVAPSDIEARWRPLSVQESAVAEVLLGDAQVLLDEKAPWLAAAVTAGSIPERLVVSVLCEVVLRVLRNPDALQSVNVSSDAVAQSFPTGQSIVRPRLEISAADIATLTPTGPVSAASGMYFVPLG